MLPPITKQPWEEFDCSIDLAPDLAAGETLVLDTFTAVNLANGADSTALVIAALPAPQISGTKLVFRVIDGTAGQEHKLTGKVHTSAGQKFKVDLVLFIVEQ